MFTTHLRKLGGSVVMAVPPALLAELQLTVGAEVSLSAKDGEIIVRAAKPRYSLEELLAQCDFSAAPDPEDRVWLESAPVGRELL